MIPLSKETSEGDLGRTGPDETSQKALYALLRPFKGAFGRGEASSLAGL